MSVLSITQTADSIPFGNDSNGYSSTNLQEAVEEAGSRGGFHYKNIVVGKTVTIPVDMQMAVKQHIKIYGQIIVRGELVIL